MAEEEVVILEDDDEKIEDNEEILDLESDEDDKKEEENKPASSDEKKQGVNKKLLIVIIALLVLLMVVVIIIIILIKDKEAPKAKEINTHKIVQKLIKKEEQKSPFSPSKIDNMIKKANVLYEKGKKQEALKIYQQIATYNEGLSFYNIGVAKMREKNYQGALEYFKKAIQNGEQKCKSAINAAVSSLHLKNEKLFKYYIDLAYTYLPYDTNSPLYSYQMGLINYYKDFYYEALSAYSHPNSKFYIDEQNYLSSKIMAFIGNDKGAINKLLKTTANEDNLPLGLLYARIGEYAIAKKHLTKALAFTNEPIKVKLALALVENKLGNLTESAKLLKETLLLNEKKAVEIYPIKTELKKSLFDITIAQRDFEKELFFNDENTYAMIFYFAPYKVFNAKQSIKYIRKGSMNIFINELGPALNYLKTSSTISKVNISIAKAIKKALNDHIYQANSMFKSLLKDYPKHAILHYNLALSYAQIGNYTKAYKHFSTSYHLDNRNYLAGDFAIMCGKIIGKDITKLIEDVKSSINSDKNLKESNLYISLIHLSENNQFSLSRWIETEKKENPLNLILDIVISQKISNNSLYRKKSMQLQALLPKDMLSNIIYFNMKYSQKSIKEYAKYFQIEFKNKPLDFKSFYYGPHIIKSQYTKLLQISGLIYKQREELKKTVHLEKNDIIGILHTLAYVDIYTNDFEESYTIYNQLIDEYNQKDTKTLFLAAVASIGAKHVENAIALLELSKLTDPENKESRYALGLLYQEVFNFKGAGIQYNKIGNKGFNSKYFSFTIDK